MKVVLQCCRQAACQIDGETVGKIDRGYMLLVGIGNGDDKQEVEKMAHRIQALRIFEDEEGKMNKDIFAIEGSILSISQFTLYANTRRGRRPSFSEAMAGQEAKSLWEYFNDCLRSYGLHVETGVFGADMMISLVNEGPKTIIFDSRDEK